MYVVCEPEQCEDAGRAVIRAVQNLTNDVTDAEIDEAKKRLSGNLLKKLYSKQFIVDTLFVSLFHLTFTLN